MVNISVYSFLSDAMSTGRGECGGSSALYNHLATVALTHTPRNGPEALLGIDYVYVREIVREKSCYRPCLAGGNDKRDKNPCATYDGRSQFVGQRIRVRIVRVKVAAIEQTGMAIGRRCIRQSVLGYGW